MPNLIPEGVNQTPDAPPVAIRRILLYTIFLMPVSLAFGREELVGANYSFALLLLAPWRYRLSLPGFFYLVFCLLAWLLGIIVFSGLDLFFLQRQFTSFMVFILAVLLLFVPLRVTVEEFLRAIVLSALLYSIGVFLAMVLSGFTLRDIYAIKDGLRPFVPDWPQRFVIVLLVAFFITFRRWSLGLRWQVSTLLILSCILVTFTRAAWLALIIGALAYGFIGFFVRDTDRRLAGPVRGRFRRRLMGATVLMAVLAYALTSDAVLKAGSQMSSDLIAALTTDVDDLQAGQSEAARLELWASILDVLKYNPLTGTGFAGIYLFVPEIGSAHSQYFDVLLRTGLIGLLFYLWLWKKLLVAYARSHPEVTAGGVALLVFGIFHETTKLTYGALIFFVLLNKANESAAMQRRAAAGTPVAGVIDGN